MIESLRRITSSLFVTALLIGGITILMDSTVHCPVDEYCLGSVFSFVAETTPNSLEVGDTTPRSGVESGFSTFELFHEMVQAVSLYLLLGALTALLILEAKELHYLKELSQSRRRRKRA